MLTDKDVTKLVEVFATKDEIRDIVREEVAEDLKEFKGSMELNLKTLHAVEGLASSIDAQKLVNAARDTQLSRHDVWIKHLAKKTDTQLP